MSKPVLAVDLGGTRVKSAVVVDGAVRGDVRVRPAPADLAGALAALSDAHADAGPVVGVGLAVPGLVERDGRVRELPGKYDGLEGFDLPGWVGTNFGVPALVRNDAVAYALGEALSGAGRDGDRVLVMTLGTGTGVGVVDRGRPVSDGPFGGGILGGNVLISEPDPAYLDTAGLAGTIEARCRADRIVDYANAAGGTYADAPAVLAAYADGEPAAVTGVTTYRDWLAKALAALAAAHGADLVVVGGGLLSSSATVLDGVEAKVRARLWPSHHIRVVPAALGDAAALVGIAGLVMSDT